MIVGIGIDIEEVDRVRQAIERHGRRFVDRVFTPGEVAYVESKANKWERYAARFAEGTNLVLLAPDVAAEFPTADAVNRALRPVMKERAKRRTA